MGGGGGWTREVAVSWRGMGRHQNLWEAGPRTRHKVSETFPK